MFYWVQVPLASTNKLEYNGTFVKDGGYMYRDDETNNQMVEYNVDACDALSVQVKHTPFGGNLRTRFSGRKNFTLVGHDECIFKKYIFIGKSWVGQNGEKIIILKDERQGLMISAFQLRELIFGHHEMTDEEISRINHTHLRKKYVDVDAAKLLRNTKGLQHPLTNESNLFAIDFQYGSGVSSKG